MEMNVMMVDHFSFTMYLIQGMDRSGEAYQNYSNVYSYINEPIKHFFQASNHLAGYYPVLWMRPMLKSIIQLSFIHDQLENTLTPSEFSEYNHMRKATKRIFLDIIVVDPRYKLGFMAMSPILNAVANSNSTVEPAKNVILKIVNYTNKAIDSDID
jgi:hypothetical protein